MLHRITFVLIMSGGGYKYSSGSISDVELESDSHTLISIINKDWILTFSTTDVPSDMPSFLS